MRLAVLVDEPAAAPRPDELDTQLQAQSIALALEALGHEVTRVPFGLDLGAARRGLEEHAPDAVVNLVESAGGSGRLIHLAPALLEVIGLRFTGARSAAMFATTHKLLAKRLLVEAGLPTPEWVEAAGSGAVAAGGASPWIVKSVCEDASIGIGDDAVVELEPGERLCALVAERAAQLGGEAFAERYVEGREFNLALLAKDDGVEVLPASEIVFEGFPDGKPRIVGYAAKWDPSSFEFSHTPHRLEFPASDRALLAELERLARRVWSLFGLSGYARVDFRVDARGQPWILEANANPCLAEDAGFAASAARANLDLPAVLARVLAAAR